MNSDDVKASPRKEIIEASLKEIKETTQMHVIVATLLVTVTFAAGFTLPGGFESDSGSHDKGMAILSKKSAFCAFVVTDAIAFVCSAGAVFCCFIMALTANTSDPTVNDLIVEIYLYRFATLLLFISMSAVVIAFLTGLYATLAHSLALAASVCAIGVLAFLIHVLVIYLIVKGRSKDLSFILGEYKGAD